MDESEHIPDDDVDKNDLREFKSENTDVDSVFSAKEKKSSKVLKCNENLPVTCDVCKREFKSQGILKKHMKSDHQDYKYPCDQCDYSTAEKGNLKRHIRTKHDGVRFPCDLCDYKGSTKHKAREHIKCFNK